MNKNISTTKIYNNTNVASVIDLGTNSTKYICAEKQIKMR